MDCTPVYVIVVILFWLLYQSFYGSSLEDKYNCDDYDRFSDDIGPSGVYTCLNPAAVLVNNMCYSCANASQSFDLSRKSCMVGKDTYDPVSTPALFTPISASSTLPSTPVPGMDYHCKSDNDHLVGASCYTCNKAATLNESTLQCTQVLRSYAPIDQYILSASTSTCNPGYTKDFNFCVRCNPNDKYTSGHGCSQVLTSTPLVSYQATGTPIAVVVPTPPVTIVPPPALSTPQVQVTTSPPTILTPHPAFDPFFLY